MAFPPRVLVFGACAAVGRYNTFSRMIDVLANLYMGTPLVSYYDHYGPMKPGDITEECRLTFTKFCAL